MIRTLTQKSITDHSSEDQHKILPNFKKVDQQELVMGMAV